MECPQCGNDRFEHSAALPGFRCETCGHQLLVTFNPPPPQFSEDECELVEVLVDLPASGATAREVSALRKLLPQFGTKPIADVWVIVRDRAVLSLGHHPRYAARELIATALELELHARAAGAA